ncbi:hypothetical protein [Moorena producens]|uniref:hypothetical protein n=1 Tax=Moorena producens TaxID=1155739 RepID=UPI001930F2AA|nr:hypothetical protein [Moorena producens]
MKVESYQTSFEASTISPSQLQTFAKRPPVRVQPSTFNLQPSTLAYWPRDRVQPSIFNLQPSTFKP